ncbi:hypothetical protein MLD38_025994 [Melastoma candidum]|uniref:Uncharacterized protein n=1 Tax=Melastoma candidum TaxID=119954 RepID=A0ACB9NX24_9MYRT|nr:hypothetical protein MLD38_025994 [Melastoma candidum]
MMKSLSSILQQGLKARRDLELLSVLRSEIAHELSSPPIEVRVVLWSPVILTRFRVVRVRIQDVLLKRKFISGEEIAVSAVLGAVDYMAPEGSFSRRLEMKVCVRKPGLSSVLQFNCKVPSHKAFSRPYFVWDAHYIQTPVDLSRSIYKGRKFRSLPRTLRRQLEHYLCDKGIERDLVEFLLSHLHRKEQQQYVQWLQTIENLVSDSQ